MKVKKKKRKLEKSRREEPKPKPLVWKKNIGYLYVGEQPRAVARRSPKFPNESEFQQHTRLWCNVSDDAPVVIDQSVRAVRSTLRKPEAYEEEVYPGTPKRLPEAGKLDRISAVAASAPFVLREIKWKTIREWVERVLEHFQDEGKALTVGAISLLVRTLDYSWEDQNKIVARIRAIYQEDWAHEEAVGRALFERSVLRTESPKAHSIVAPPISATVKQAIAPKGDRAKGDRDKWGFRRGSRCERINNAISNIPKTSREIEAEAKCHAASSHLGRLVGMGVVVKIGRTFKLAKEQECRAPNQLGRSEGKASMQPKEVSKSDRKAKHKHRVSSTANSRKEKHARSGKRRGRKDS